MECSSIRSGVHSGCIGATNWCSKIIMQYPIRSGSPIRLGCTFSRNNLIYSSMTSSPNWIIPSTGELTPKQIKISIKEKCQMFRHFFVEWDSRARVNYVIPRMRTWKLKFRKQMMSDWEHSTHTHTPYSNIMRMNKDSCKSKNMRKSWKIRLWCSSHLTRTSKFNILAGRWPFIRFRFCFLNVWIALVTHIKVGIFRCVCVLWAYVDSCAAAPLFFVPIQVLDYAMDPSISSSSFFENFEREETNGETKPEQEL